VVPLHVGEWPAATRCLSEMEHAVVWFSFKAVVIGGLLLALAVFLLGVCCEHWLGRDRDRVRARQMGLPSVDRGKL
jgi:hypothetical protein